MIGRDVSDGACTRRIIERLEPMQNVFDPEQQRRRFAVDPLALIKAEKSASAEGKLVLGFYHSHPDHPARPSEFDREHAWPWYSYVIVSVQKGEPENLTAWVLKDGRTSFDPE